MLLRFSSQLALSASLAAVAAMLCATGARRRPRRQLTQWCQIQPDVQYVFSPGGGGVNPDNLAQRIKNEAVIGARANITF